MADKCKSNATLHKGHRTRMIQLFMRCGSRNLHDYQLLELLLYAVHQRRDTNPIAHRLIDKFGSIDNVFNAEEAELLKVEGVGSATVAFLKKSNEFIERLTEERLTNCANTYERFKSTCLNTLARIQSNAVALFINRGAKFCGYMRLETNLTSDWELSQEQMYEILRREPVYYVILVQCDRKLPEGLNTVFDYYKRHIRTMGVRYGECLVVRSNMLYMPMDVPNTYGLTTKRVVPYDEQIFKETFKYYSGENYKSDEEDDKYRF